MNNIPVDRAGRPMFDERGNALSVKDREQAALKNKRSHCACCGDPQCKTGERITELEAEITALQVKCERLLQEAQSHHGEDNAHKSIQLEIYQGVGIQRGDWNGAAPVLEKFKAIEAENAALKELLVKSWGKVMVKDLEEALQESKDGR